MKTKQFFTTALLILSLITQNIWAQNPIKKPVTATKVPVTRRVIDTVKNTDFSLNGQYQFMLSRSKTINGYKLINPYRLTTVWQSATDTIRKEKAELTKIKSKIAEQEKTIEALKSEIANKESTLQASNTKVDEINFLGLSFTKGTYNIFVWSIIIILAIALFIVIARSAKNIIEAKHRTQLYDEISNEFQSYKTKANEKERKLARELQDERNIVEELKARGKV